MKHGSRASYLRGCRCPECREASSTYLRNYRAGVRLRKKAEHGTYSGYTGGCRCPECRAANAADKRERREKGLAPPVHGRDGYANHRCRCDICRAGWRAYRRDYRQRSS